MRQDVIASLDTTELPALASVAPATLATPQGGVSAVSPFVARCYGLAVAHDWTDAARFLSRTPDGVDLYAVSSASQPARSHVVRHRQRRGDTYPADGQWTCPCQARGACRHIGAAMLLAAQRAEIADAINAARDAGMTAAWARFAGGRYDGCEFWRVPLSPERGWEYTTVLYDPRDGRQIGRHCDCGRLACPHLGAVAMRYQMALV